MNELTHKCSKCSKTFEWGDDLRIHQRRCGKYQSKKESSKRKCEDEEDRTCLVCGHVFASKQAYGLHIADNGCKKAQARKHRFCPYCFTTFDSDQALKRHGKKGRGCKLVLSQEYQIDIALLCLKCFQLFTSKEDRDFHTCPGFVEDVFDKDE